MEKEGEEISQVGIFTWERERGRRGRDTPKYFKGAARHFTIISKKLDPEKKGGKNNSFEY